MKKLLVLLVVSLFTVALSAGELTETKYHEYLDRMEFLGSMKLEGQISESILLENEVEPKLIYQVFYDFESQTATIKVSDLKLHKVNMQRRGITSEQFAKKVIQFYLNSDISEGDGTKLYKVGSE